MFPVFIHPEADYPLVCDLCETNGERRPECVEVCPNFALEYMAPQIPTALRKDSSRPKGGILGQTSLSLTEGQDSDSA